MRVLFANVLETKRPAAEKRAMAPPRTVRAGAGPTVGPGEPDLESRQVAQRDGEVGALGHGVEGHPGGQRRGVQNYVTDGMGGEAGLGQGRSQSVAPTF